MQTIDLRRAACFGVAGNFTGHLEQAGEAESFAGVRTREADEPKALFPTYIPCGREARVPDFLKAFPFDSEKIVFPKNEEKIQIEPELAILFRAQWKGGVLVSLEPEFFGASNDVSIRKAGAAKISEKKNWGASSKGFSRNAVRAEEGVFERYRIASYLKRGEGLFEYGENSPVLGYSYFGEKLNAWLLEKFNFQKNEGPAEDIHSYLEEAGFPREIFVSVGSTRYSDFGKTNFLRSGDEAVVAVYPDLYSAQALQELILGGREAEGVSLLRQRVVL